MREEVHQEDTKNLTPPQISSQLLLIPSMQLFSPQPIFQSRAFNAHDLYKSTT